MHTFCLCQYCRSALTCWQWRNFKPSGVCEVESCVQTSWPFLWSGHTLSCSLAARWHAFSGWHRGPVKQVPPWLLCFIFLFSPFPATSLSLCRCLWLSLSLSLSLQLRSFSSTLVTNSSCQSQRRKWNEHVIFRGSEGNLRRNVSSLFQQSTLSSDFCLYDKRIMAPCFKCTKGCFVPLNHHSFKDIVVWCGETSNDDVSVIISVGCNCIVFFTSVSSHWFSSTFFTHVFHLIKCYFWMNNRPELYFSVLKVRCWWVFFSSCKAQILITARLLCFSLCLRPEYLLHNPHGILIFSERYFHLGSSWS